MSRSIVRMLAVRLAAGAFLAYALAGPALAQQAGATISGLLLNSVSGEPIAGATVVVEELQRSVTSRPDGTYAIAGVPPGAYHLTVKAAGYSPKHQELKVAQATLAVNIFVDPELHYTEVTSVSADARNQFEAYQPTSVLAGQELQQQLGASLGQTLESQAGLATRSLGPAPARPVIRGLDGDRVLILEDGQRMGDLSSQSGDHGVTINPAAAKKIEVVRGPATLLYGASAIGGLVNVITDTIPSERAAKPEGRVTFDAGTGARDGGGAADIHAGQGNWAFHVGGGGRKSGWERTPEGAVENSQMRNAFGDVGASWVGDHRYVGASYGYEDSRYGVPVVEGGHIELTPRRHSASLRASAQQLGGFIDSYRATFGYRRYRHEELDADVVGTLFKNDTYEGELLLNHRAVGKLKGTVGGWLMNRDFAALGEESLAPPTTQKSVSAFAFEEATWPHVTFQVGGRVDHARYRPDGLRPRDFTTGSGSIGLLLRPASDRVTVALSLARASRYPALEELYFFGPHTGNFAFEIANEDLAPENALGFDLSLRWRTPRVSGEVTYFRNDIGNYIFRQPMTTEVFERTYPGVDAEQLLAIRYEAADSVLQGVEAHADAQVSSMLFAEVGADYVRAELKATGDPLPRMPPMRVRGGLRFQKNAFQAGGEVVAAGRQDRIYPIGETTTAGYQLVKIYSSYSFESGGVLNTVTARLDNATNELYRNHLSLIKDVAPEMGRSARVLYSISF